MQRLNVNNRTDFRDWLEHNHIKESECWVEVKKGKPDSEDCLFYLDAVEEAMCYGWIDSTNKLSDGIRLQRFSPRKKNSPWTEKNKERARRLEKLGLMTDYGRTVLPELNPDIFEFDDDFVDVMKKNRVWTKFRSFPLLYQRIRAYNISFYKRKVPVMYEKALDHLITETKKNRMFGDWNDYGRLTGEYMDYSLLCEQIKALTENVSYNISNYANASALIFSSMEDLNWAGFYIVEGDKLVLGPFQGKVACTSIPKGKGVCGTSLSTKKTILVPNVHEFEGHIACDSSSNSEIVIPVFSGKDVVAVLDIDSPLLNRFDENDKIGLENFVRVLEKNLL